jgi:hypothetical protein
MELAALALCALLFAWSVIMQKYGEAAKLSHLIETIRGSCG